MTNCNKCKDCEYYDRHWRQSGYCRMRPETLPSGESTYQIIGCNKTACENFKSRKEAYNEWLWSQINKG